jgi:hypothetical protein
MKFPVFFIGFIIATLTVSAQKTMNDPNVELRTVAAFRGIDVSGPFEVYLQQGNEEAVAVSAGDKDHVQFIRTTVDKGILKIWFDQKTNIFSNSRKLRVYISIKNIEMLTASGASVVNIDGSLSSTDLRVRLSGASDLKGSLNVSGDLKVNLSGASDLTLKGSASSMDLDISGASKVKAYDLVLGKCKTKASGASSIQVTVEKELSAQLSGASKLVYQGNAVITDIKTGGASSVSRKS